MSMSITRDQGLPPHLGNSKGRLQQNPGQENGEKEKKGEKTA